MNFLKELGKKFAMSAASTLGIIVILGIWSGGLEKVFMKKTEKIFKEKTDEKKND